MHRTQHGFTLVELLIAMVLAATISLVLVVAFRLGVQFLERGRGFYGDVQENFAVVSLMRRTVAALPQAALVGDERQLLVAGSKKGMRCSETEQGWTLESFAPAKNAPPAAASAAPAGQRADGDKAPASEPEETTLLLSNLKECAFSYLLAQQDTPKDPAKPGGPQAAGSAPQPGPTPVNPAVPGPGQTPGGKDGGAAPQASRYAWEEAREAGKGRLAAVRFTLASQHLALPPVVLRPNG
ncbi:prepilin-type N-terminal cleavage/methylation domain-containing protein [Chitinimonas sp.]|uniref:PulJ/GspJ family protein n=1 Tax=Chitinimonas sp. TaxID=1934313 RepID=UPI0035AF05B3